MYTLATKTKKEKTLVFTFNTLPTELPMSSHARHSDLSNALFGCEDGVPIVAAFLTIAGFTDGLDVTDSLRFLRLGGVVAARAMLALLDGDRSSAFSVMVIVGIGHGTVPFTFPRYLFL
jgi:hypothetical protein